MKSFAVVCLVSLFVLSAMMPVCARSLVDEPSPFALAERVGERNQRAFFLFSTSAGNYTIRHDGMGEFTSRTGMRKIFNVKVGIKSRIERLYFLEYKGDLLLLYETSESGYAVRLEQRKRKTLWTKSLSSGFAPPVIRNDSLVFTDGTVIPLD